MKTFLFIFTCCLLPTKSIAGNPYREYLLSEIYTVHNTVPSRIAETSSTLSPAAFIPRFERPKGAIFCRMEDKVTKATKVWLKIGVQ